MTATWTCWRDARHTVGTHEFGWPQCMECGAAPAYHERPAYLDDRLNLLIFVPASELPHWWGIAPGSAMVGQIKGDRALVYYEGWPYGAAQYADRDARGQWEAGVLHAAGRMVTAYPTGSLITPPASAVKAIGLYAPKTHTITLDDEEALDAWLASKTSA